LSFNSNGHRFVEERLSQDGDVAASLRRVPMRRRGTAHDAWPRGALHGHHIRPAPARGPLPWPAQTPPPSPTAAEPGDGRVQSSPSSRVHQPRTFTRPGCPAATDGLDGFRESHTLLRRVRGRPPALPPAYLPRETCSRLSLRRQHVQVRSTLLPHYLSVGLQL